MMERKNSKCKKCGAELLWCDWGEINFMKKIPKYRARLEKFGSFELCSDCIEKVIYPLHFRIYDKCYRLWDRIYWKIRGYPK